MRDAHVNATNNGNACKHTVVLPNANTNVNSNANVTSGSLHGLIGVNVNASTIE